MKLSTRRLRGLDQPIISSEARGLRNLCQPISSSAARGFRSLGQPITSSEAAYLGELGPPISSSGARGFRDLGQPITSSEVGPLIPNLVLRNYSWSLWCIYSMIFRLYFEEATFSINRSFLTRWGAEYWSVLSIFFHQHHADFSVCYTSLNK